MIYDQLNFFDMTLPEFQIDKPIRLIELFAGIGSQAMALRDLGADFEHYRVVEFDRFAVASYNAIHDTDFSATDITQINGNDLGITETDQYCYIMTYSFPCQDLSVAGKQKGMTKGSGTRSGLLWEVERLLNECEELPKVLLMENVPQVHSKDNMPDFQKWISFLEDKGYSNYWQDLNAKDYGVAQNRDRCFMVSLLGEWNYKFPKPKPLKKKLKDYLEDEVDEKHYINTEKAQKLIQTLIENGTLDKTSDFEMDGNFNQRGKENGEESVCRTIMGSHAGNEPKVCVDLSMDQPGKKEISNCITSKDRSITNYKSVGNGIVECKKEFIGSIYAEVSDEFQKGICPIARCIKAEKYDLAVIEMKERRLGNIYGERFGTGYAGNVWDLGGISPSLMTMQGGGRQPMIVVMYGKNPDNPSDRTAGSPTEQRLEQNSQGICNTLSSVQKDNMVLEKAILPHERTEYGKAVRKAYENGEVKESRHNMTELQPQTDGISNTLTTVQKDNMVLERAVTTQGNEIAATIRACIYKCGLANVERNCEMGSGFGYEGVIEPTYRIRKLTPLECWRLMGFSDEDFLSAKMGSRKSAKETLEKYPHLGKRVFTEVQRAEKMSNSQLYKQAGNSIVKDVLMEIFGKMIPGDMLKNQEERRETERKEI